MHIPAKFVLFSLLALAISSCQSPSDEIRKAFDKVDKSIERSNKVVSESDSLAYYHQTIDSKTGDNGVRQAADSLYTTTQAALMLFTRVKDVLHAADTSGFDTKAAARLLVNTTLGDSVRASIRQVSDRCHKSLIDPETQPALNKLLANSLEITDVQWDNTFTGTPTVGALTVLSYFQSRCTAAAIFTLADVNVHLKP